MSKKSLGHHFYVIDNTFILHFDREVYRKFYPVIDFASFEIIESNGSTFHYFKDKNHVYIESYMNYFAILPDAEPKDFKIIDFNNGKSTSAGNDYLFDEKLPHRFVNYRILSEYYQLAEGIIYFNFLRAMPEADVETFGILHEKVGNVAKDKKNVYFRDQIVNQADAPSFHFLEACFSSEYYRECDHTFYAKDNRYAYYVDSIAKAFKIIKTKNLEHFRFNVQNKMGYASDGKYSYRFGKRLKIVE